MTYLMSLPQHLEEAARLAHAAVDGDLPRDVEDRIRYATAASAHAHIAQALAWSALVAGDAGTDLDTVTAAIGKMLNPPPPPAPEPAAMYELRESNDGAGRLFVVRSYPDDAARVRWAWQWTPAAPGDGEPAEADPFGRDMWLIDEEEVTPEELGASHGCGDGPVLDAMLTDTRLVASWTRKSGRLVHMKMLLMSPQALAYLGEGEDGAG